MSTTPGRARVSDAWLRTVMRLARMQRGASVKALLLSVLLAGTEGVGVVSLIPLLSLVGLAGGESERWLDLPILRELGMPTSIYTALAIFSTLLILRQWIVLRHRLTLTSIALDFSHRLREEFFAALIGAEWKYFSAGTAHRQSQILTSEAARAGNTVLQSFTLVSSLIVVAIQLAIAAYLSATFTLVALTALLVFVLLLRGRVMRSADLGHRLTRHNESLYAITTNLLPLLRTTKIAGNSGELQNRFDSNSRAINDTLLSHTRNQTVAVVKTQLFAAFSLSAALIIGMEFLGLDALSASLLVVIFTRLTPLFVMAVRLVQELVHSLAAVTCSLDSISLWRERDEASAAIDLPALEVPLETIELVGVSGGYNENEPILREVSIRVPVGATTLIVGRTGAGKSTLADMIVGLLTPQSGQVLLDGRPLTAAQLPAWRARIGYVEQAVALFTGTLRENLLWGTRAVDPDWFARVLDATSVADFVEEIGGGLDGSVGQDGAALSGGQKQRLAIARELMRKPVLLVLDEATSGLDDATQRRVLENIASLDPSLTTILISHRPAMEQFADVVVELEAGRVKRLATPSDDSVLRVPA